MAASRQRLHHRHQRRHSAALARLLALCALQPASPSPQSTSFASRAAISGTHPTSASAPCSFSRRSQLLLSAFSGATTSGRMLVIWVARVGQSSGAQALSHLPDLCCFVIALSLSPLVDHRRSLAIGDLSHHRPQISTLHLLHDHRPKDHCSLRTRSMHGRFLRCRR